MSLEVGMLVKSVANTPYYITDSGRGFVGVIEAIGDDGEATTEGFYFKDHDYLGIGMRVRVVEHEDEYYIGKSFWVDPNNFYQVGSSACSNNLVVTDEDLVGLL